MPVSGPRRAAPTRLTARTCPKHARANEPQDYRHALGRPVESPSGSARGLRDARRRVQGPRATPRPPCGVVACGSDRRAASRRASRGTRPRSPSRTLPIRTDGPPISNPNATGCPSRSPFDTGSTRAVVALFDARLAEPTHAAGGIHLDDPFGTGRRLRRTFDDVVDRAIPFREPIDVGDEPEHRLGIGGCASRARDETPDDREPDRRERDGAAELSGRTPRERGGLSWAVNHGRGADAPFRPRRARRRPWRARPARGCRSIP